MWLRRPKPVGRGSCRAVTFPRCGLPAGRHGHALHSLERGRGEAGP